MRLKRSLAVFGMSALMVFSLGMLAGCGGQSDEEVIRESLTQELESIKNLDDAFVDEMIADMDVDELAAYGIDGAEFMKAYLDGFDYTVDGITVDGDTAEATITMTCKSFDGYQNALTEAATAIQDDPSAIQDMTESELNLYLGELIMNTLSQVEVAQTDPVTIEYTKSNNTWEPAAAAAQDITYALMSN